MFHCEVTCTSRLQEEGDDSPTSEKAVGQYPVWISASHSSGVRFSPWIVPFFLSERSVESCAESWHGGFTSQCNTSLSFFPFTVVSSHGRWFVWGKCLFSSTGASLCVCQNNAPLMRNYFCEGCCKDWASIGRHREAAGAWCRELHTGRS